MIPIKYRMLASLMALTTLTFSLTAVATIALQNRDSNEVKSSVMSVLLNQLDMKKAAKNGGDYSGHYDTYCYTAEE